MRPLSRQDRGRAGIRPALDDGSPGDASAPDSVEPLVLPYLASGFRATGNYAEG